MDLMPVPEVTIRQLMIILKEWIDMEDALQNLSQNLIRGLRWYCN